MSLGFGSDPTVCMQCIVKVVKALTKPVNQKYFTLPCASHFLKVLNSFECVDVLWLRIFMKILFYKLQQSGRGLIF